MSNACAFAIQALDAFDAPRIAAHLLRLAPEDRSARFAAGLVTDTTICRYVGSMRFGHDALFGLVDANAQVVGLAHGCVFEVQGRSRIEAAFSVDDGLRGLGLGTRLMRALDAFASVRDMAAVVGLCASRNLAMRRIFERAGMQLTRADDEVHAMRCLQPLTGHGPVLSGRSGKLACRG